MISLLSPAYLPPINYVAWLQHQEKIYFNTADHYQKQTFRNRCEIMDANGLPLGVVTSGTMAPSLGIGIGMGYVAAHSTAIGTPLGIKIRKKTLPALIVKTPFYKG